MMIASRISLKSVICYITPANRVGRFYKLKQRRNCCHVETLLQFSPHLVGNWRENLQLGDLKHTVDETAQLLYAPL